MSRTFPRPRPPRLPPERLREKLAYCIFRTIERFPISGDEAIGEFQAALRIDPNFDEVHYNLGNVYLQQRHIEQATREYQLALRINPDHADAHYNLGLAYGQQDSIEEAIAEFRAALRISPDFAAAHCYLGVGYAQQGHMDTARREVRLALQLGYAPAREWLARLG